ncbi:MAG: hypothetical protein JWN21_1694 [Sphingomonas bacterium]|nr:hypothetical protein [Sphingomonas bacterium]
MATSPPRFAPPDLFCGGDNCRPRAAIRPHRRGSCRNGAKRQAVADHRRGAAAFTNIAGQLRASVIDSFTTIDADTNGDGIADLSILLHTNPALVAGDFIL